MIGYGTAGWGTGPYSGLSGTLSVVNAFALTTHDVVVELNRPPLDVSPFVAGDVRNPRSWRVLAVSSGTPLEVAGVVPYERPLRWQVRTLRRLPTSQEFGRVSIANLRESTNAVATGSLLFDFAGVTENAISTPAQVASTATRGGRDLRNVPAPQLGEVGVGGTLCIVGGDYALTSGVDLVRKMIIRRLTTLRGEFFHLPDYGVGLNLKQPLAGGGLERLKKRIEMQLLLEPDVSSVSVSVSQSASVLTVVVRAQMATTGQQVSVALDSSIGQG